jgi:hypothetical protein
MEFLLEPLEVGAELDRMLDMDTLRPVRCNTGYVCKVGSERAYSDED